MPPMAGKGQGALEGAIQPARSSHPLPAYAQGATDRRPATRTEPMKILITGGTGFIGSRLSLRCLRQGQTARVLGLEKTAAERENRRSLEEQGIRVAIADIVDSAALDAALEGVDTVVHLAAAQHEMNVPDSHFQEVNVEGTRRLLDASLRNGVRRFVHGSTIGVYGQPRTVVDEETECRPDNIYGETKLEGERLVLSYADRLPVVVLRIPEVYGPGDQRLLKLFRSIDSGAFCMVGGGENVHPLIFVDDLIDALLAAARSPDAPGHVFVLQGAEAATTAEMVAAIARALGKTGPRFRIPIAPLAGLATLMEVTLRPLGVQPPLHRRRLDFFRKSFRIAADKAHRHLRFDPRVGLDEGMRRTAEWYRETGLL